MFNSYFTRIFPFYRLWHIIWTAWFHDVSSAKPKYKAVNCNGLKLTFEEKNCAFNLHRSKDIMISNAFFLNKKNTNENDIDRSRTTFDSGWSVVQCFTSGKILFFRPLILRGKRFSIDKINGKWIQWIQCLYIERFGTPLHKLQKWKWK